LKAWSLAVQQAAQLGVELGLFEGLGQAVVEAGGEVALVVAAEGVGREG